MRASTCRIYGLGLEVNVPIAGLAGLQPAERVDVALRLGSIPPDLDEESIGPAGDYYSSELVDDRGIPTMRAARLAGSYYRIAYGDGTRVVIDACGERIWASAPPPATVEDTATYLLGPALGFTLRLRGVVCLHASAVVIEGRAVAFVGAAGAGKSSTAAAFARRGHAILTDDVAALVDLGSAFEVQPAYPRLRLWPDTVAALFGTPDAMPRITPSWEKRYIDLNAPGYRFHPHPLPLAAIYLLGERIGEAPRCDPVARRAALMPLVSETYTTRLIGRSMRAKEFELLGRIAEHVPVRRLSLPNAFREMDELCAVVIDDVRALSS